MPLVFDAPPEENPEVRALKEKIKEVADQYTRRHGWCDVVNQALADAGVTDGSHQDLIPITVSLELSATVPMSIDPSEFAGLSAEEANVKISEILQTKLNVAVHGSNAMDRVSMTAAARTSFHEQKEITVEVLDANVYEVPPEPPSQAQQLLEQQEITLPTGYQGAFTSREGRVLHLRYFDVSYTACRERSYRWSETSPRSEGRICRRCLHALGLV